MCKLREAISNGASLDEVKLLLAQSESVEVMLQSLLSIGIVDVTPERLKHLILWTCEDELNALIKRAKEAPKGKRPITSAKFNHQVSKLEDAWTSAFGFSDVEKTRAAAVQLLALIDQLKEWPKEGADLFNVSGLLLIRMRIDRWLREKREIVAIHRTPCVGNIAAGG